MRYSFIVLTLLLITSVIFSQDDIRSGVYLGAEYQMASHTNPYVYYEGSELEPTSYKGFEDKTSQLYFPFGYSVYSPKGYSEFSTSAAHYLLVGAGNLINPNKEYEFNQDHAYKGDSYADGYVPVFDDFAENTSEYWNLPSGKGIEASYSEVDLFRIIYSGAFLTDLIDLPFLIGVQGGVGNIGVHFARVEEGHEPSDAADDGPGLTAFNELVDLYYGVNVGYATPFTGKDLMVVTVQYDFYYFIKGTVNDEYVHDGNRLTIDAAYFPFENDGSVLGNLFFKVFYKTSTIPYLKKFNEKMPIDYSNSTFGLGVNLYLL